MIAEARRKNIELDFTKESAFEISTLILKTVWAVASDVAAARAGATPRRPGARSGWRHSHRGEPGAAAGGLDAGGVSGCRRWQGVVLCVRLRARQPADGGAAADAVEGRRR